MDSSDPNLNPPPTKKDAISPIRVYPVHAIAVSGVAFGLDVALDVAENFLPSSLQHVLSPYVSRMLGVAITCLFISTALASAERLSGREFYLMPPKRKRSLDASLNGNSAPEMSEARLEADRNREVEQSLKRFRKWSQ